VDLVDDPESWRWVWLAVAAAGLGGEILTAGSFFLLPFALGAAAACVAAFVGAGIGLQWAIFVGVSALMAAATRPLAKRVDRIDDQGVGARRWVGQTALVLDAIPAGHDETGLVRVGREEWRAQTAGNLAVPAGVQVTVIDVLGTRLVVEPLEQGASR
jgi:membrane protein implicated in regulation of membrane protease activity